VRVISVGPAQGQVQIPVLCRRCHGPAEPRDDGSITCRYCGALDQLPADQLGRALELKRRLAAAKASVANIEGLDAVLGGLFEDRRAFRRVIWLYGVVALVVTAYSVGTAWPSIVHGPRALRATFVISALSGGVLVSGIVVAMFAASMIGRRRYRKHVRGHVLARLPRRPGMPARCRACGGDLPRGPDARGAFLACAYCTTTNLVTPELAAHHAGVLEDERAFYQWRTGKAIGGMRVTSLGMSRTFTACVVLAYAVMIALQWIAQSLIAK
jgi:hypothetical protein